MFKAIEKWITDYRVVRMILLALVGWNLGVAGYYLTKGELLTSTIHFALAVLIVAFTLVARWMHVASKRMDAHLRDFYVEGLNEVRSLLARDDLTETQRAQLDDMEDDLLEKITKIDQRIAAT